MKEIKIGLVGVGGMGKVHYANILQIEDCSVTAVCGKSQRNKAQAEAWGLPCFDTISEMVESGLVNAVDICTPTFTHHQLVMESLGCAMNTIVEKPVALSYADAEEMLTKAESMGVNLYVAQVLQFTKEVGFLRNAVKSGEYGKPLDAYFERLSACPSWTQDGWLFDVNKSGLLPYDLHIHDLDVIVSVFGEPKDYSFTFCQGEGKSYPEQFRVSYDYGALHVGAEAAWFNANIPWTARWRVYFENGMLINDGQNLTVYQPGQESKVIDTTDEVMVSTGINVPPCGWYYNELRHFADCIRKGVPSPYVSKEQLLTVMKLLEGISSRWRK